MKKSMIIVAVLSASLAAQAEWATQGGVTVYTNEANWTAALTAGWTVQSLDTTAANLVLADEVSGPLSGSNDLLGDTLTFDKANTGFDVSFSVWASKANNLVYNDNEGNAVFRSDALSVGDVDNDDNDNLYFNILGGDTVFAAGYTVLDNEFSSGEQLRVRAGGTQLGLFDLQPLVGGQGNSKFIGVISSTAFDEIWFDESHLGGDDMAVKDFKIAAIPEPAAIALVALFGGGLLAVRRIFQI